MAMTYLRLVLLMYLLLVSCTEVGPAHRDCTTIAAQGLRELLFHDVPIDDLPAKIAAAQSVPASSIEAQFDAATATRQFSWQHDGASFTLLVRGSRPEELDVFYLGRPFEAADVVSCLGAPSQYGALYARGVERYALNLNLLYPEQGIMASGARFDTRPQRPPRIDGRFPVYDIWFAAPGSSAQVVRQTQPADSEVSTNRIIRQLKAWPGNWQTTVVEVDPSVGP
jgi:hypothetical protein